MIKQVRRIADLYIKAYREKHPEAEKEDVIMHSNLYGIGFYVADDDIDEEYRLQKAAYIQLRAFDITLTMSSTGSSQLRLPYNDEIVWVDYKKFFDELEQALKEKRAIEGEYKDYLYDRV